MLTEPMTLYKLMNLYLLKQVNFPLTEMEPEHQEVLKKELQAYGLL